MTQPVNSYLIEVLQAVTARPETLEEIRERFEKSKRTLIKVETSWISRTMLPNSFSQNRPPKSFENAIHELVRLGFVKRSLTRYLDEALDKDTEIFSLNDQEKR